MKNFDNSLQFQVKLLLAHRDLFRSKVPFITKRYIKDFHKSQIAAAQHLKGKEIINVAFFLTIPGMWKADYVFKAMQESHRFNPYIVIYPYSQYKGFSKEEISETLKRTEEFVKERGYRYIIPYDDKKKCWVDIKKTENPDVVFFSSPYKDHLPKYFIYHFKDRLTCYIPYGFTNFSYLYETNYNLLFHNLIGCYFLETEIHKQLFSEHSRCGGVSGIVTGYPGTEVLLRKDYQPQNVWKPQDTQKKRVIWAPHHSIEEGFALSSFLTICDNMLHLAEKYSDTIQFAFKPHQLLKFKLQQLWGMQRTEEYYTEWARRDNTQVEETSYIDLFLTSDAMIHDSGSFTTDYIFTRKPVLFTIRSEEVRSRYSPFGEKMFDVHYHAHNGEDIDKFLSDVVLAGNDPMADARESAYRQYLQPIEGQMPSERIIHEIEKLINR